MLAEACHQKAVNLDSGTTISVRTSQTFCKSSRRGDQSKFPSQSLLTTRKIESSCNAAFTRMADNIYLYARGSAEAECMMSDLLLSLWLHGLDIYEKSRQFMLAGSLQGRACNVCPFNVPWTQVNEIKCLGVLVTANASSNRALGHRQHAAEIVMAKKRSASKTRLPFNVKLRAWQTHRQASAAYAAEVVHLNQEVLHDIRRWEHQQVRRAFCIRP